MRVGIPESIIMAWTWQTTRMCWALPSGASAQMWTDVSAARLAEVVEGGGFEYGKHWMRCQGLTVRLATIGRKGRGARGWRGARARLLKPGLYVVG